MNTPNTPPEGMEEPTPEEIMSALFANLVIQNTNMALMFLGKVPHPQTGQPIKDLESAQMFIDQLEMLAYKTRNNLDNDEQQLLKQSLLSLRLSFVEELRKQGIPVPEHLAAEASEAQKVLAASRAAGAAAPAPAPQPSPTPAQAASSPSPSPAPSTPTAAPSSPAETEESRKRFTKKY
jgi:hypothetical protein